MKPEYRYEVILYWSEPDQGFIAEVPELPGVRQTARPTRRRWRRPRS